MQICADKAGGNNSDDAEAFLRNTSFVKADCTMCQNPEHDNKIPTSFPRDFLTELMQSAAAKLDL